MGFVTENIILQKPRYEIYCVFFCCCCKSTHHTCSLGLRSLFSVAFCTLYATNTEPRWKIATQNAKWEHTNVKLLVCNHKTQSCFISLETVTGRTFFSIIFTLCLGSIPNVMAHFSSQTLYKCIRCLHPTTHIHTHTHTWCTQRCQSAKMEYFHIFVASMYWTNTSKNSTIHFFLLLRIGCFTTRIYLFVSA